jgi:alanine or glycine:cation symporter, AGCS family
MHFLNDILNAIDGYLGSSQWFVYALLGTGVFFSFYLVFPQVRYFKYALKIVRGKFDRSDDKGDTSRFQALSTALSGTVGTGNIAGVALAVHLGGPPALFWMLVTAVLGMTTKMVEVTLSHKYREFAEDGSVSGGPMYYMKKRLNINLPNGKKINTGVMLAGVFAVATIFSSFGTGNLPQVNSIANSMLDSFGIEPWVTGGVLAVVLAFIVLGGIKRIAKVSASLVPTMAIIYFIGAISVILYNYENILPSLVQIGGGLWHGTAAVGGFLGASLAFAMNRGVNRGLFSNESGQGSAPIAHSAARASEPVSEGLVALLEPFIDTIIICSLTGLAILSSGVWNEKLENKFQMADIKVITIKLHESDADQRLLLQNYIMGNGGVPELTGELLVVDGRLQEGITMLHNRSVAEDVRIKKGNTLFSGQLKVNQGRLNVPSDIAITGKSLLQSAPLTNAAFTRSWLGDYGKYIVSIGLLLFAFSTSISWSYYGSRAVTYLFGVKAVRWYMIVYVAAFFWASVAETSIIWALSGITIALMTVPNLLGMLILHREVKEEIIKFWQQYKIRFPNEKSPRY